MISNVRANRLKAAVILTAALTLLNACSVACPTTEISVASRYMDNGFAAPENRQNKWLENARLDRFLRRTIQADGVAALSKKHGLSCVAQPLPGNCSDCYVCAGTIKAEVFDIGGTFGGAFCSTMGTISIRADIGPGDAATSMTYWTTRE